MIFGIFGKFGIEIGDPKKFSSRKKKPKKLRRKNVGRKIRSNKNRKLLVPKKNRPKVFGFFFRRKIVRQNFFGSPISIPNDPKIPKITLRTACDHYKITKSEHEKKEFFFRVR